LKLVYDPHAVDPDASPPHGGVWIETDRAPKPGDDPPSPPHGGVWIETSIFRISLGPLSRHPLTGGCGLKHLLFEMAQLVLSSPPHGGVWIETGPRTQVSSEYAVTPSRGGVD